MTEVNPLVQKLRKLDMDCIDMIQKHPEFTMLEYFNIKNNAALAKWNLLKKEGLVISNWRPF